MHRWAIVAFWFVLSGCATTSRFTTRAELEKVLSSPKPVKIFRDKSVDVDRWELLGPFPDRIGDAPLEASDPWTRLFVQHAVARGARPSGPLACAARETARFVAAKGGYPGSLLTDFIVARCGNAVAHAAMQSMSGDAPDGVTDEQLFEHWQADVTKLADGLSPGESAGLAFVRDGGRAVVMLMRAAPSGAVEPLSIFPFDDNTVVVRGNAPAGAGRVFGYANQGATKSVRCRDTNRFALPSFELVCEVDGADARAWVDVSSIEKGRLLGNTFAQLLVWPRRAPSNVYERPVYGTPGGELTPEGMLARLNEVRTAAGMKPLELSVAQSADNHELAPFFFDAVVRNDAAVEDRIAMGVIAGWRVESEISGGSISSAWVDTPDLSLLLAHQLESAGSRAQLLDPEHRVLAVGFYREEGFVAALVSAYSKVAGATWPDSTEAVMLELDAARKKAGLPEVQWIRLPSQLEKRLAEGVGKKELDDEEALQHFMDETVEVTRRPVHGWRIEATKLNDINWPEMFLKKQNLEVLGTVAVQRKKDDPWADYLILMVVLLNDGANQT